MKEPERTIARRTVVKGATWSIPVIAATAAAPLAAASEPAFDCSKATYLLSSQADTTGFTRDYRGYDIWAVPLGTPVRPVSTFTYLGPGTLPAGLKLTLVSTRSADTSWVQGLDEVVGTASSFTVAEDPSDPIWIRTVITFTDPIPAGTAITVKWWFRPYDLASGTGDGGNGIATNVQTARTRFTLPCNGVTGVVALGKSLTDPNPASAGPGQSFEWYNPEYYPG